MMWKLIIFVAGGSLSGADGLIFLDKEECLSAAQQVEELHDGRQGTSIKTACIKGLFWKSSGD
ncbi:hypothetical protein [Pseudophaeobacter sp.]|uniref:hypothetical protein n=1 Tax=Pseudophaeobacter sp. TaxID=1971739 RepID=UPI0032989740